MAVRRTLLLPRDLPRPPPPPRRGGQASGRDNGRRSRSRSRERRTDGFPGFEWHPSADGPVLVLYLEKAEHADGLVKELLGYSKQCFNGLTDGSCKVEDCIATFDDFDPPDHWDIIDSALLSVERLKLRNVRAAAVASPKKTRLQALALAVCVAAAVADPKVAKGVAAWGGDFRHIFDLANKVGPPSRRGPASRPRGLPTVVPPRAPEPRRHAVPEPPPRPPQNRVPQAPRPPRPVPEAPRRVPPPPPSLRREEEEEEETLEAPMEEELDMGAEDFAGDEEQMEDLGQEGMEESPLEEHEELEPSLEEDDDHGFLGAEDGEAVESLEEEALKEEILDEGNEYYEDKEEVEEAPPEEDMVADFGGESVPEDIAIPPEEEFLAPEEEPVEEEPAEEEPPPPPPPPKKKFTLPTPKRKVKEELFAAQVEATSAQQDHKSERERQLEEEIKKLELRFNQAQQRASEAKAAQQLFQNENEQLAKKLRQEQQSRQKERNDMQQKLGELETDKKVTAAALRSWEEIHGQTEADLEPGLDPPPKLIQHVMTLAQKVKEDSKLRPATVEANPAFIVTDLSVVKNWHLHRRTYRNVTHVLSVVQRRELKEVSLPLQDVQHLVFEADDQPCYPIVPLALELLPSFLETLEPGKQILIHCAKGVNRSASVAVLLKMRRCMYQMRTRPNAEKLFMEAWLEVWAQRKDPVLTNWGFQRQLYLYAYLLEQTWSGSPSSCSQPWPLNWQFPVWTNVLATIEKEEQMWKEVVKHEMLYRMEDRLSTSVWTKADYRCAVARAAYRHAEILILRRYSREEARKIGLDV